MLSSHASCADEVLYSFNILSQGSRIVLSRVDAETKPIDKLFVIHASDSISFLSKFGCSVYHHYPSAGPEALLNVRAEERRREHEQP